MFRRSSFNEASYLARYGDVRSAVVEGLFSSGRQHFKKVGKREGRIWAEKRNEKRDHVGDLAIGREKFKARANSKVDVSQSSLEIGPLHNPFLNGARVKYFDILPTVELRQKAIQNGLDANNVPEIHYFDRKGDLGCIPEVFDLVTSSHVIEHQPDFIGHLKQVSGLLTSSGEYWLNIPDKRFCFDHYLPESRLTEILKAHQNKENQPNLWQILEHEFLKTHNDPLDHWLGRHGGSPRVLPQKWNVRKKELESETHEYIDVHCWQFTPESFLEIMENLKLLGLSDLSIHEIYPTAKYELEFQVVLKKNY